jgi:hypothetical protein
MENKRQKIEQKHEQHDKEADKEYDCADKKQREYQQMNAGFL